MDHYIDGVLENKNGGVGNPVETNVDPDLGAVPVTIGGGYFQHHAARLMEGRVDEVRIYSQASYDEIQQLASGKDVDGPPSVEITNNIEGAELLVDETPIEFSIVPQGDATVAWVTSFLSSTGKTYGLGHLGGSPSGWTGFHWQKKTGLCSKGGCHRQSGRTYASFSGLSLDNFAIEAGTSASLRPFYVEPCNIPENEQCI